MTIIAPRITGGVDTHLDLQVAAALDERGALLGVESFPLPQRASAVLGLGRGFVSVTNACQGCRPHDSERRRVCLSCQVRGRDRFGLRPLSDPERLTGAAP